MTPHETMGEVIDENGTPPPGFNLDAEASGPDPVAPGIIERAFEPEPDDDGLPEIISRGPDESGAADDDDTIDDPDNATPLGDF